MNKYILREAFLYICENEKLRKDFAERADLSDEEIIRVLKEIR